MSNLREVQTDIELHKKDLEKMRKKLKMIENIKLTIKNSIINKPLKEHFEMSDIKYYYRETDVYKKARFLTDSLINNAIEDNEKFKQLMTNITYIPQKSGGVIRLQNVFIGIINTFIYDFLTLKHCDIERTEACYLQFFMDDYDYNKEQSEIILELFETFKPYISKLSSNSQEDYDLLECIDGHIQVYIINKTLSNIIDAHVGMFLLYIFKTDDKIFEYINRHEKYLDEIIDKVYKIQYDLIKMNAKL